MASIDIENVQKSYGAVKVLHGVDLRIRDGEFIVLVGPSGCGKSTLLRMVAGLEEVTDGEIRISGNRVNELPPKNRDIAMVFQSYALYPHMNVAGNMSYSLRLRKTAKEKIDKAIAGAAAKLGLEPFLERRPKALSGGQRQRVAMGRAIVRQPKAFLFDEPLSNLDARLREQMRAEIKKMHGDLKATSIYVTHDQIEAMTLASRIAVLRDGVLQQFGTPSEIYDNPANMFVADFMGSPAMNLIPATVAANGNGLAVQLRQDGRQEITLRLARPPDALATFRDKPIVFGIRPEALTDPEGAERDGASIATADCHIEVVEPAGSDTFAVTNLGGKGVVARLRADAHIRPGTLAPLAFNLAKAVFFDPATEQRIV